MRSYAQNIYLGNARTENALENQPSVLPRSVVPPAPAQLLNAAGTKRVLLVRKNVRALP